MSGDQSPVAKERKGDAPGLPPERHDEDGRPSAASTGFAALPLELIGQIASHLATYAEGGYPQRKGNDLRAFRLANRACEAAALRHLFSYVSFPLHVTGLLYLELIANSRFALHVRHLQIGNKDEPNLNRPTEEYSENSKSRKTYSSLRNSLPGFRNLERLVFIAPETRWNHDGRAEHVALFLAGIENLELKHLTHLTLDIDPGNELRHILIKTEAPDSSDWWKALWGRLKSLELVQDGDIANVPASWGGFTSSYGSSEAADLLRMTSALTSFKLRFIDLDHRYGPTQKLFDSQEINTTKAFRGLRRLQLDKVELPASSLAVIISKSVNTLEEIYLQSVQLTHGWWEWPFEQLSKCPQLVQYDQFELVYFGFELEDLWKEREKEDRWDHSHVFQFPRWADWHAYRDMLVNIVENRRRQGIHPHHQFGHWEQFIKTHDSLHAYRTSQDPNLAERREEDNDPVLIEHATRFPDRWQCVLPSHI